MFRSAAITAFFTVALAAAGAHSPLLVGDRKHDRILSSREAIPLGLISPTYPSGLPPSSTEVDLGRKLFFDASLSLDKSVSCSTCHQPTHGYAEDQKVSIGISRRPGERNSLSLLNVAFNESLGWDGGADTVERSTLNAIYNDTEMGLTPNVLQERLQQRYSNELQTLYREVTPHAAARALAAFQRSLLAGDSNFDRYLYLGDQNALSPSAKRGFSLFLREARCIQCHMIRCDDCHPFGGNSALFLNDRFHDIGVSRQNKDHGRKKITGAKIDEHKFRTPTLRNVAITGPYMHDGSIATLEKVIEHYNDGGDKAAAIDQEIKPLKLTREQRADLVEFLKSLTSKSIPQ